MMNEQLMGEAQLSVTHRREQKLNKSSSEGPKSSITITL